MLREVRDSVLSREVRDRSATGLSQGSAGLVKRASALAVRMSARLCLRSPSPGKLVIANVQGSRRVGCGDRESWFVTPWHRAGPIQGDSRRFTKKWGWTAGPAGPDSPLKSLKSLNASRKSFESLKALCLSQVFPVSQVSRALSASGSSPGVLSSLSSHSSLSNL